MLKKIFVTALLALGVHLGLGWAWTVLAGVVGGFWQGRRGWLVGAVGVGLGWLGLIVYNLIVALGPVGQMAETFGGILSGAPALIVLLIPPLVGALLGTAGGGLGTQLSLLTRGEAATVDR